MKMALEALHPRTVANTSGDALGLRVMSSQFTPGGGGAAGSTTATPNPKKSVSLPPSASAGLSRGPSRNKSRSRDNATMSDHDTPAGRSDGATKSSDSRSRSGSTSATSDNAPPVKETHHISIDYNPVSGRKCLNEYEILKELGRGQHGKVKLGYDTIHERYVAVKTVNRKDRPRLGRPQGQATEEKARREIAILKKCHHPNILEIFAVLDDESSRKIYLILEYCSRGEVKWQTSSGKPLLSRERSRQITRDVMKGLEYLHSHGIVHRDIKPANLLLSDDWTVKISDFGVSYAVQGDAESDLELAKTVGTPAFFAPEMCTIGTQPLTTPPETEIASAVEPAYRQRTVSSKIDVWALGVTLFAFLYGHLLYDADNEYELFHVIANEPVVLPEPTDDDLIEANDLLARLLKKDPAERSTIAEAMRHPWVLKGLSQEETDEFLSELNDTSGNIEVSQDEVSGALTEVTFSSKLKRGLAKLAESMRSKSKGRHNDVTFQTSSMTPRAGPFSRRKSSTTSVVSSISRTSTDSEPPPRSREISMFGGGRRMPPAARDLQSNNPTPETRAGSIPRDKSTRDIRGVALGQTVLEVPAPSGVHLDSTLSTTSLHIIPGGGAFDANLPDIDTASLGVWSSSSSSSSEDYDTGELTLALDRGRSRSNGASHPFSARPSRAPSPAEPGQNPSSV